MPRPRASIAGALLVLLAATWSASARAQDGDDPALASAEQVGYRGNSAAALFIPRVPRAPQLADFADMRPPIDLREGLALAEDFVQREPSDGDPATQRTQVYLGYDDTHLHAVFVAWDTEPDAVRARLSRREDIDSDDRVTLLIDTYRDEQRAYEFAANPLGVQRDALWTEGRRSRGDGGGGEESGRDVSFDTLWESTGMVTDQGYVVVMSIPFKSLRFPRESIQEWGMVLSRWVPRGAAEESNWPPVSSRIEGRLNQAGLVTGLEDISPGRNIRFIPYGTFRSFRALGETGVGPGFITDLADPAAGLDAKFVLKDSIVVDATFNPDFSQVESDQPQQTVNRRFEVFFPERRPFFLENANYFETPLSLLFTRRIADPKLGMRATGKVGGWAIGGLAVDNLAPGEIVPEASALHGARARHGVLRVSRDLPNQSNVGAIYVDRTFGNTYNRVGGFDTRVKLNRNWVASMQAVASRTRQEDGTLLSGPGIFAQVARSGRKFDINFEYLDLHEDFRALSGFIPRVGIRRISQRGNYGFRPEGEILQAFGPGFSSTLITDRHGKRLETSYNPWLWFDLAGQTNAGVWMWKQQIRLRPIDYATLESDRDYSVRQYGAWLRTDFLESLGANFNLNLGTRINFVPAAGIQPEVGDGTGGDITLTFRPNDKGRLSATWLTLSLTEKESRARVFRSDIYRARFDWQFSREFSLRTIVQYQSLTVDERLTMLEERENINADILLTYLVNPWTSLYVGYNSNAQNLELLSGTHGNELRRTDGRFLNDSSQFFVKFSYLVSY